MTGKTPKSKKRSEKIVQIHCEWGDCESIVTLLPAEYETFSAHLKEHVDEFVLRLHSEMESTGVKRKSCCCMWRKCSWEGCEDFNELTRHVMFHGYHTLLRSLGKLEQTKLSLNDCQIEQEDHYHMLTFVTTPFICLWNNCRKEHVCPNKFYRHVEKHVLNSECMYDDQNRYRMQCFWDTCTNTFRDKHKLKEHVRVHTHEKLVACHGCGGLFSNRTKLFDHLSRQNASAYENFQCSHCMKRCASERLLRDHMRHHVNYLKCPQCDMTCPNPGSLKYHMNYRHSEERPFPCSMCQHSFKSNSDLIRHEESHLPKSYLCSVAGCSFTTKTSHCLKRHIKITHTDNGTKRYICHICNHAYSRGFGLTKHLKKKHNFSWPSGHPRFRYIEYDDGFFRLQMVRFESIELAKKQEETEYEEQESGYEVEMYDGTIQVDSGNVELNENVEVTYDPSSGVLCAVNKVDGTTENLVYTIVEKDVSNEVEIEYEVEKNTAADDVKEDSFTEVEKEQPCDDDQVDSTPFRGDVYLQPKPEGYDMSVMAQLVALSTGKQSIGNSTAATSLVSDLYKRLLKVTNKNGGEFANQLELEASENVANENEAVVFEQIACQEVVGEELRETADDLTSVTEIKEEVTEEITEQQSTEDERRDSLVENQDEVCIETMELNPDDVCEDSNDETIVESSERMDVSKVLLSLKMPTED